MLIVESLIFIGAGAGAVVGAGEKNPGAGEKRTGSVTPETLSFWLFSTNATVLFFKTH